MRGTQRPQARLMLAIDRPGSSGRGRLHLVAGNPTRRGSATAAARVCKSQPTRSRRHDHAASSARPRRVPHHAGSRRPLPRQCHDPSTEDPDRHPSRRPLRIQAHQNPGSGPRCDLHPCAQLQLVGVMRALKLPPAHKVARAAIRVAALPSSCCCTYVAHGELGEALKAYYT